MDDLTRRRVSVALVSFASIASVFALIVGYVLHAGVNTDQFADRATVALRDENVRNLLAQRITDDIVLEQSQDLLASRPLIESAASGVLGSTAFTGLFRSAVADVHRAVFEQDQSTVTLAIPDIGTLLAAGLEQVRPGLAKKLDLGGKVEVLQRNIGTATSGFAHFANTVRALTWILVALWALAVAAAIRIAPDGRRVISQLGVGAAAAGGVLAGLLAIARSVAVHSVSGAEAQAAAGGVWDAFLGDLRTEAWILAGLGAVVAAASASLIRPPELGDPLRRLAERLRVEPRRPGLRVARAIGLVVAGLLLLTQAYVVMHLVVTIVGLYLVYEGVAALLKMTYRPEEAAARAARERPSRRRHVIAAGLAGGIAVVVLGAFVGSGSGSAPSPAPVSTCNGFEALCGRSLEQVALPATHNAMSVPLSGWYSAEQGHPIPQQLAAGVRGLLLDTHYGEKLPDGSVKTNLETSKLAQLSDDSASQAAVQVATRIRDRLGFSGSGKPGIYLCHTFCELGATPLEEVLTQIHDFLVANPDAVLVIVNEDYVKPSDFVAAVEKAGLAGMAYSGPTGIGEWPTLREMIDSGQRVVFLAENHAGSAPWYRPAYKKILEETPFNFNSPSQLIRKSKLAASCRRNRGPANAPLFLVNHWVSTDPVPKPSDAAKVNAVKPLLDRLRECERIRDHMPNLVAVNFYEQGNVFKAVDKLNGVKPPGG